jgi:Rieske Fe-S protein
MQSDRREFIKKALYWVLAFLGFGWLTGGIISLVPTRRKARELIWVPLLPEEEIPRQGVRRKELSYRAGGREGRMRLFVVSGAGGFIVLSAVCSHLGCLVNYQKEKKEFLCPCHGGRYDLTGKNIAGPPPAPLSRLPVKLEKGTLLVGVKV